MNGANNYFSWKQETSDSFVDSRTIGIIAKTLPAYSLPAERVNYVTVPGRSGSLTIREGEDEYDYVYDDVVKSVECYCTNTNNFNEMAAYLKGSGQVLFPNRPNGFYYARITNQIDYEQIVRGKPNSTFTVEFTCEPFWYLSTGHGVTRYTTNDPTITNGSDMFSEPEIAFYARSAGSASVNVNNYAIEINFPEANAVIHLDSRLKMAYRQDYASSVITLANSMVTLESGFPRFLSGVNTIHWDTNAISYVDVRPRWRWR